MPRAPQKAAQSNSAVNVICVDVNALLRAAREKEARERSFLDDRPVLGKTIDDILEEEMRNNNTDVPSARSSHCHRDDAEEAADTDDVRGAATLTTSNELAAATGAGRCTDGTVDGYLIKGCPSDAMVFPPLSPADPTILQQILRNPEVTLAQGTHLTSRPSWMARDGLLSASSRATQDARPVSSTSSASSTARETFPVVPHVNDRFRAQRGSRVELAPYISHANQPHSTDAVGSLAAVGRASITQVFIGEGAPSRRVSRMTELSVMDGTHRGALHSDALAADHGPYHVQLGPRRIPTARLVDSPRCSPSVTTSTVDCLVFGDRGTVDAAPHRAQVDNGDATAHLLGGRGSALAKQYLCGSGATAIAPVPSAPLTVAATGAVPVSSGWEPLPSVSPRTHTAGFCSTLRTALAVRTDEADRYHQQVRRRQLVSKPPPSSPPVRAAATMRTAVGRGVPVALRHAADVAKSQPKTRRPKRQ